MPEQALGWFPLGLGLVMEVSLLNFNVQVVLYKVITGGLVICMECVNA